MTLLTAMTSLESGLASRLAAHGFTLTWISVGMNHPVELVGAG